MNEQTHDNGGFKAIAIVTAVVGGIALATAGTTAAFGAVHSLAQSTEKSERVDVRGVTELSVDASAGDVTIRFDDVEQAEMHVTGSSDRWRLERDEDELTLRNTDAWWGWSGWSWFDDGDDASRVTLVLPQELAGLDAELSLNAGGLDVMGDFGELDLDVTAGSLSLSGSANAVDAEVSAGDADLELANVRSASLSLSAGEVYAELTGAAPSEVEIEVTAGALDLTLPDAEYAITQDVSSGSFDNGLRTASGARHTVAVEMSAGGVTLRAGE